MNVDTQQGQVDPELLQQVVQSLLGSSGVPMDASQVTGTMPDSGNGNFPTLDPTFLAQLQDTISQAGLFNTANLNALVSNTSMPDMSRFFPVEDNNTRGRFYPCEDTNERHEEHRQDGREEDYYYDRERLIDRNLSRFYNNDRNYSSRDSHRSDPRSSSPSRDSHQNEPRGNSPSRRSRTPPRDASQLSEEDLLVQARRAVEAGRNRHAEESRGQKRSSPDNISDRPEKRQKTSTESTPTKSSASDKNKPTSTSEASYKSDSLRKSAGKPSNTNATIIVTANGPVDLATSSAKTPSSNMNATNKTNEATKASSSSASPPQTSTSKATPANTNISNIPKAPASQSSGTTSAAKGSPSSSSKSTGGAVSSSEPSARKEVGSGSGSAPSVASAMNGTVVQPSAVVSTTGGSGGAKSGSTTVGTSGTNAVSSAVNTTGSSSSASVQGGGSVASGSNAMGESNTMPASKATTPTTFGGAPKAPVAGKSVAAPTTAKPVVFVPVKPEPVRNNTATPQQAATTAASTTVATVPQTNSGPALPSTTSTVVQGPSASAPLQTQANIQSSQATAQLTASSLLGVSLNEPSSATSASAPQTTTTAPNTIQGPPTSNPLAPPGLPPPVSSASKSVALGFIKNMLEDNPVIPQPPSSPISPPRSPKRIDKPQVWHGYLAKRGIIVCDMVAYFLGGSDLWRKLYVFC
jgi:hypothetical protein